MLCEPAAMIVWQQKRGRGPAIIAWTKIEYVLYNRGQNEREAKTDLLLLEEQDMGTQTLTALQLPFLLWSLWVLATGILGALTLFFWIRRENLLSLDDDDLLSMVLDVSDPRSIEKEFARKVRARHLQRLLLIGSSLCFFSGSGICLTMLNFRKTPLLLSWQIPLHDLSICTAGVSVLLCVYLGCRVLLYGFHLSLQSSWFPSDQQRRERRLQRCLIACIAVGLITSSICAMLG